VTVRREKKTASQNRPEKNNNNLGGGKRRGKAYRKGKKGPESDSIHKPDSKKKKFHAASSKKNDGEPKAQRSKEKGEVNGRVCLGETMGR